MTKKRGEMEENAQERLDFSETAFLKKTIGSGSNQRAKVPEDVPLSTETKCKVREVDSKQETERLADFEFESSRVARRKTKEAKNGQKLQKLVRKSDYFGDSQSLIHPEAAAVSENERHSRQMDEIKVLIQKLQKSQNKSKAKRKPKNTISLKELVRLFDHLDPGISSSVYSKAQKPSGRLNETH